jgi:ABC-type nitrate/sulfonate/bicarbonate transport systems, periplasmic components
MKHRDIAHPLALASLLALPLSAHAADKVAFQLDWTPGGISAAYYLGKAEGCFTDQGIDVEISRGYGAADAVTKVATGVADFSVTDLGTIIGTYAETQAPVKAILPIVSSSPMAVAVLEDSPIHNLKDLEGHSIGSSVGNAAMAYLPLGMELAGADITKVEEVTAERSALTGLLLQGKIDALASYVTSVVGINAVAQGAGKSVRAVYYGDSLDMYNASVFTSDAMIAENPDLVARFAAAVTCSYEKARANPEAAIDALVDQVDGILRESQTDMVPNSLSFAFDTEVFETNGYRFDMDRVTHTIEMVDKVTPLTRPVSADDVVYVLPE